MRTYLLRSKYFLVQKAIFEWKTKIKGTFDTLRMCRTVDDVWVWKVDDDNYNVNDSLNEDDNNSLV